VLWGADEPAGIEFSLERKRGRQSWRPRLYMRRYVVLCSIFRNKAVVFVGVWRVSCAMQGAEIKADSSCRLNPLVFKISGFLPAARGDAVAFRHIGGADAHHCNARQDLFNRVSSMMEMVLCPMFNPFH